MEGLDWKGSRVAHIVPSLDVGGVEVAIARARSELESVVDYRVFYVRTHGRLDCGQQHVVRLLIDSGSSKWRPDVVVTSLWPAHVFGAMLRGANTSWVASFHNSKFKHDTERKVTAWTAARADACLADSHTTREFILEATGRECQILPYAFNDQFVSNGFDEREFDLIWVGRNAPQKRIDLVVKLIRRIAELVPQGRAAIVIAGDRSEPLEKLGLEIGWQVRIEYSLPPAAVRDLLARSRFYLILSDYEGMSMTTVEAVQAGCIPVARPVGELARYLEEDGAILVDCADSAWLDKVAERVANITPASAERMRFVAQDRIRRMPSYVDAFLEAIRGVVK